MSLQYLWNCCSWKRHNCCGWQRHNCCSWQRHNWSLMKRLMASETGKADHSDQPHSGCPVTAIGLEILQCANAIIWEDHCMTTWLALGLAVSKGNVSHIIQDIGYLEVCLRGFSWSFAVKHKTDREAISSELLACFEAEGETFVSWIVTADETWVHHFELETKRQSIEWYHPQSLWKKKFKNLSMGRVMITVFWDCEGVILVDTMLRGMTFNSDAYFRMQTELSICLNNFYSQEANRNLASAWQYKAAHKFVEVGSHHKIWADSVTPSTLLPQSSSLRFTHIYSSESFSPQYKVWDQGWCDFHSENLAMWTGQGMISKRHTHSCSLVEGHRSGWKLCGKTGYGVKPSLFINV